MVEYKKLKVALYARVSTEEQDANQQIKDCASLSQWGEPFIFIENQSAWKDNKDRPKFDTIINSIKSRKLEHLIVWDLDRIYRNRLKLIDFFKFCKVYGCTVHSVRQTWLEEISKMPSPWNDIMFDLMLNIMGWLAEEESSKKSDRVKKAVNRSSGSTLSYKGKKWGRKAVDGAKLRQIEELMSSKRNRSVRFIAKEVGLSVGTVHKYITEIQAKIMAEKQRSVSDQLTNNIEGGYRKVAAAQAFVDGIFAIEGSKPDSLLNKRFKAKAPPLNSKLEPKEDESIGAPQSDTQKVV